MNSYSNTLDIKEVAMFTLDSKEGQEVVGGIECSLRLLSMLHKITWDADIRIVAMRMLNSVNEFMPDRHKPKPEDVEEKRGAAI